MKETVDHTPSGEPETPQVQAILRPRNLGDGLKPEYVLDRFPATIGRHPSNDVELPFDSISRYHARIEISDGQLQLVDLRSSNGSFINGKKIQHAPLADHDTVTFGSVEFALLVSEQAVRRIMDQVSTGGDETSVQFLLRDDLLAQSVFQAELPGEASHADFLEDEITDDAHLKKAKQRLISLYRLQDVLRSTTDEERLLRAVLALLFDVLPVDRGAILTREERNPAVFRPIAIQVKPEASQREIGVSRTILQRCMKDKVAILSRDAASDVRFKQSESIVVSRMRSVMCAPLISARRILGFIHLDTTDAVRSFSEEDLTFLAHAAQEVAIHLHNLRMIQEKILSERMAAIGQTITGMAHNIKNILVLSQGGIEMLEKRLAAKHYEALDETWNIVRRGVDRINRLVQDMLDYSRARRIDKRKINVNEFCAELCQSYADEMARRGIQCRLSLDEGCPPLMLDVDGLEKALANLFVNAMEACQDQTGVIELRTRLGEDHTLAIEVEDNGAGIAKEVLPRIFIPFFTTKGPKGSGLGLAMTKKIVEDMGGSIAVKSALGKGTRFTITLAYGPSTPRLAPAPPPPATRKRSKG